jgi:hypothetical protein
MEDNKEANSMALLEVNRLDFRLAPALSVATSRSMKSYPALNSETEMGGVIVFPVSSGSAFVDWQNSFAAFDVFFADTTAGTKIPNTTTRMSPHTGYANMFRRITLIHSSGVEIDRINDGHGEWVQIQNYYNKSETKRQVHGSLYGLNDCSRPGSVLFDSNNAWEDAKKGLWYTTGPEIAGTVLQEAEVDDEETEEDETKDEVKTTVADFTKFPDQSVFGSTQDWRYLPWLQKSDIVFRNKPAPGQYSEDVDITGKQVHVVIPLSVLMGFFDIDVLAPSVLAAGLRIELEMYRKEHFFQKVRKDNADGAPEDWGSNQTVIIKNPRIHLESFQLTDSIARMVNQISAESGLEIGFDALHNSRLSTPQLRCDMQINRALSRANIVVVKSRTTKNIGGFATDSFASDPWDVSTGAKNQLQSGDIVAFQVQLGAQYIPAAPIGDSSVSQTPQFLHSALKSFAAFRRSDEIVGIPLWKFRGVNEYTDLDNGDSTRGGLAIAAVPLETSSTLQQSGAAISAMRTAVINIAFKYDRANVAENMRVIDCYVPYSKLVTCMLDSVVVRA